LIEILNVLALPETLLELDSLAKSIRDLCNAAPNEATIGSHIEKHLHYWLLTKFNFSYHPQKETTVDRVFHLSKGRTDSRFGCQIIEYKFDLSSAKARSDAIKQAIEYLHDLPQHTGAITDGRFISFIRIADGIPSSGSFGLFDGKSLSRLMAEICNAARKALTPFNLVEDFRLKHATPCFKLASALFQRIQQTPETTCLAEWQKIFRLSHDDPNKQTAIEQRKAALADALSISIEPADNTTEYMALYALHTAYAIIVKAIAYKFLTIIRFNKSLLGFKDLAECPDKHLQTHQQRLESGAIFHDQGIRNLLEGDFFTWYCNNENWNSSISTTVSDIFATLSEYEDQLFVSERVKIGDLFRRLYEAILPAKVRHSLGEFYTPAWLADNTVGQALAMIAILKWKGIDPCCGSGTVLTNMIDRVINSSPDLSNSERLAAVIARVKGCDLNPLAVLTARINYFANISHLVETGSSFTIPIYVDDATSPKSFQGEKFDIIVGNPAWIDWRNLPLNYREKIKNQCVRRELFSGDGQTGGINLNVCALVTSVVLDVWLAEDGALSFLMPDTLLRQRTYEGFRKLLGSQTYYFFHKIIDWTKAGHPFPHVQQSFFTYVISSRQANYQAGIPVECYIKNKTAKLEDYKDKLTCAEIAPIFQIVHRIASVAGDSSNFHINDDKTERTTNRRISGSSKYTGRQGFEVYPQELLIFEVVPDIPCSDQTIAVQNIQNIKSKYKILSTPRLLERKYLSPVVKGPCIQRFHLDPSNLLVAFPYDHGSRSPVAKSYLEREAPMLAKYLDDNRSCFDSQSEYTKKIVGQKHATEYYALARVGDYTHADHFVAFRDNTEWCAVVVSKLPTPWEEHKRPVFQKHAATISMRDTVNITLNEAHYICAILNAPVVMEFVRTSCDFRSFPISPPIRIPFYDEGNPFHRKLSGLSLQAHAAFNNPIEMARIDRDLDRVYLECLPPLDETLTSYFGISLS
jgi:hypothetical protein